MLNYLYNVAAGCRAAPEKPKRKPPPGGMYTTFGRCFLVRRSTILDWAQMPLLKGPWAYPNSCRG